LRKPKGGRHVDLDKQCLLIEVRGYKRAPIWAPKLPLALHPIPARPDGGQIRGICGERLLRAVASCYTLTSQEILERAAPTIVRWRIAIFPPEYLIDPTMWNRVSQKFALMEFSEIRVRKESYFWLYKP
jgi:hypothetical protein